MDISRECKEKCVTAGMAFADDTTRFGARYLFPINVRGLVKEQDLFIPHSELAIHVGAAGKELLAWGLKEDARYAYVVYQDNDRCCLYTHGLPNEVLSPELLRKTKELLHI